MFSIVDRYVARSFLYSLFIFFFLFLGLFIVVETFSNIEDFLDAGLAQLPATLLKVYAVRIFTIFQQTSAVVVAAAAVATITRMNKNNELVPLKASGLSVYRILWPIFLICFLGTGFFVLNQESIIPKLADKLVRYEKILRGKNVKVRERVIVKDSHSTAFRIREYRIFERRMLNISITEYFTAGRQKTGVTAGAGVWKRSADGEYRWHFSNGSINRYDDLGESLPGYPDTFGSDGLIIDRSAEDLHLHIQQENVRNPSSEGGLIPSVADTPWIHYILSDLTPQDVERERLTYQYLSTRALRKEIAAFAPPAPAELLVMLHRRYSWPLANIILLMLAVPLVLLGETKNVFLGVGVGVVVCTVYFFVDFACTELGGKELVSPVAAAWLPVLVFGPLGVFLFDSIRS